MRNHKRRSYGTDGPWVEALRAIGIVMLVMLGGLAYYAGERVAFLIQWYW